MMQRVWLPVALLLAVVCVLMNTALASDSAPSGILRRNADESWAESFFMTSSVTKKSDLAQFFIEQLSRPPVVCDVHTSGDMCMVGADMKGKRTVTVPTVTPDTVGMYTFDELMNGHIVDRSGNGHHGIVMSGDSASVVSLPSGPDRLGGSGGSAKFNGKVFAAIPEVFGESVHATSLSGWFFLSHRVTTISPKHGCAVWSAGSVSLALLPTSHLLVHIGDRAFVSHAKLRSLVWSHIAVVHDPASRSIVLYVNGIKDIFARNLPATPLRQYSSASKLAPLDAASLLYVGGLPNQHPHYAECSGEFLIDDFRASNAARPVHEIAAESFPALGAIEASFVTLGCGRHNPCNRQQAMRACPAGYHLCSRNELLAGGLAVGRAMGWIEWSDQIWAAPREDDEAPAHTHFLEAGVSVSASAAAPRNPYEALDTLQGVDSLRHMDHYAMLEQELAQQAQDEPQAQPQPKPETPQQQQQQQQAPGNATASSKPAAAAPKLQGTVVEEAEFDYLTVTPPDATFLRAPSPSTAISDSPSANQDWMSKLGLCCRYN